MTFFPELACLQPEFDKIKQLLSVHCLYEYARNKKNASEHEAFLAGVFSCVKLRI